MLMIEELANAKRYAYLRCVFVKEKIVTANNPLRCNGVLKARLRELILFPRPFIRVFFSSRDGN